MEWSSRLKRDVGDGGSSVAKGVWGGVLIALVVMIVMVMFGVSGGPEEARADGPTLTEFQRRLLEAEEEQARSLKAMARETKDIAEELEKIRRGSAL